jgi:hypothetical protein
LCVFNSFAAPKAAQTRCLARAAGDFKSLSAPIRGIIPPAAKSNCLSVAIACYVAVVPMFYGLFRPVSRSLSLIAAFFGLVGNAVLAINSLNLFAPLLLLGGAQYLSVFKVEQLQALALMFLKLHAQGSNISLVFFGFYCLLIGYLIFRSTFLPRILGVLMAIAGLGWLTNSFANFLSPPLANYLSPYILLPGLLGEGSLCAWLLVIGVNVPKWEEKASAWRVSGA